MINGFYIEPIVPIEHIPIQCILDTSYTQLKILWFEEEWEYERHTVKKELDALSKDHSLLYKSNFLFGHAFSLCRLEKYEDYTTAWKHKGKLYVELWNSDWDNINSFFSWDIYCQARNSKNKDKKKKYRVCKNIKGIRRLFRKHANRDINEREYNFIKMIKKLYPNAIFKLMTVD